MVDTLCDSKGQASLSPALLVRQNLSFMQSNCHEMLVVSLLPIPRWRRYLTRTPGDSTLSWTVACALTQTQKTRQRARWGGSPASWPSQSSTMWMRRNTPVSWTSNFSLRASSNLVMQRQFCTLVSDL